MPESPNVHEVLMNHMNRLLKSAAEEIAAGTIEEAVLTLKAVKDTREAIYEWDRNQHLR